MAAAVQVLPELYGGQAELIPIEQAVQARLVREGMQRERIASHAEAAACSNEPAEGRLTRAGRYCCPGCCACCWHCQGGVQVEAGMQRAGMQRAGMQRAGMQRARDAKGSVRVCWDAKGWGCRGLGMQRAVSECAGMQRLRMQRARDAKGSV